MSDEQNKVKDESQDQKYFTITPRLVWALARNPFDYTLWATIKSIAGEGGECYLSTDDLAALSMMSVGQVHDSRKYWIGIGLLKGSPRRDEGYSQSVWHISVPDLWQQNTEWALKMPSLKDRVALKREQRIAIATERKEKKKAIQQVKPSPSERKPSPGEPEPSPGELKNIHVKKNQEEDFFGATAPQPRGMTNPNSGNRTDARVLGDQFDGMMAAAAQGAGREMESAVLEYPADVQQTLAWMVEIWRWPWTCVPTKPIKGSKGGQYAQWINELRDINTIINGYGRRALEAVVKPCKDLTISHPAAITWALPGEIGKLAAADEKKSAALPLNPVDTPLARAQAAWKPGQRPPRPTQQAS